MSEPGSSDVLGAAQQQSVTGLINAFKAKRETSLGGKNDELIQIATKRRQDTIKFTEHLLKTRLVKDLDQTIDAHLSDFPELKGKFFVGILTDGGFRAEVVPMEGAIASVQDFPSEEAETILRSNPVGYFNSADFTLKTPNEPAYEQFKQRLDRYFKRNADVIQYLRTNPQNDSSLEDLYQVPPGTV